jgi:hypothetical protein
LWLLAGAAALSAALYGAYLAASAAVEDAVLAALGPNAQTRDVRVGLGGLVLEGLHVRAPDGWPADETLAAERVAVAPRLVTLISGEVVRIRSVELDRPYLSVRRTRAHGLEALPGLAQGEPARAQEDPAADGAVRLSIGAIEIESGVLELFDATIARPAQKLRLEQIDASVHDLALPGLEERSAFELDALVKGKARDGRARLSGWVAAADRDSDVSVELRGVDLVPLQAYLVKPGDARVTRGSLDLDLHAQVAGGKLAAKGRCTLDALELASGAGLDAKFLGVSNQVLLAALKDRGGRLAFDFTLSGDIDDPHFSLNEAFGRQVAFALAENLGLTVGGIVKGVGSLGVRGGEALGSAAKDAGGKLLDLFKRDSKD